MYIIMYIFSAPLPWLNNNSVCIKGKEEETHSVEVREAIVSRDGYSFVATGKLTFQTCMYLLSYSRQCFFSLCRF